MKKKIAQHRWPLEKYKSKPQQDITSRQQDQLFSRRQKTTKIGKDG